jgi:hypothetical protein
MAKQPLSVFQKETKKRTPRVLAYQIMRRMLKDADNPVVQNILGDVRVTPDDVDSALELLWEGSNGLIDKDYMKECGCCGYYHRSGFNGDCRDDEERFP